jgi:hypothetical protein
MKAHENAPQNQENDLIDMMVATGVSSGIFFVIFVVATVIRYMM